MINDVAKRNDALSELIGRPITSRRIVFRGEGEISSTDIPKIKEILNFIIALLKNSDAATRQSLDKELKQLQQLIGR